MKVRGLVFRDGRMELTDELVLRAPHTGEVVVRNLHSGVCHSDISVMEGTIPWPSPVVLGHEGAGVVEQVGDGVTSVAPGDHVVVSVVANCGHCRWCATGLPTRCRSAMGNLQTPFELHGSPVYNFAETSSFAELCVVKEVQVVKVPHDLPLAAACVIGCSVLTGAGTVFNRSTVTYGASVAVWGVGGIGLNVIQACRMRGAERIIAVDRVASKEVMARQFGATDFVDSSTGSGVEAIRSILTPIVNSAKYEGMRRADGVDHSFECVGSPALVRDAIDVLGWGGTCHVIGVAGRASSFDLALSNLSVDKSIVSTLNGATRPHRDIPMIIDLYRRGLFLLDELVTTRYPLAEFDRLRADLASGSLARGVLDF